MIEISGGAYALREESAELAQQSGVRHPVLWDKDNRNHDNYGIQSWPAAFLIDASGKVFWQGNPAQAINREDERQQLQEMLKTQLEAADQTSANR
jgi:hypothetical protein